MIHLPVMRKRTPKLIKILPEELSSLRITSNLYQGFRRNLTFLILLLLLIPSVNYAQTVSELIESAQYEAEQWNFDSAAEYYDQALEQEPDNAEIYYLRAVAHDGSGNKNQAIDDYSKALELGNQKIDIYYNRAMLFEYIQEYQRAIDDLTIFLQTEPNYKDAYSLRAECRYQLEDFDGAIADYSKVITLVQEESDLAQTYYFRAFVYFDKEEYEKALFDFKKAQELDPGNRKVVYRIIRANSKLGKFEESLQACDELIEANERDLEAYFIRSEVYLEQGRFQLAIEDLDHVLGIYPLAEAYLLRGKAKAGSGEKEKALGDYNEALNLKPDYPECKKAIEDL